MQLLIINCTLKTAINNRIIHVRESLIKTLIDSLGW